MFFDGRFLSRVNDILIFIDRETLYKETVLITFRGYYDKYFD